MAGTAGRIALIAAWVVVVGGVAAGAGYLHSLGPPDGPALMDGTGGPPGGPDLPQLSPPTAHDQAPPADAVDTAPAGPPPAGPDEAALAAPDQAPPPSDEHAEAPVPPSLPPLQAPHAPPDAPAVAPAVTGDSADAPEVAHLTPPGDPDRPPFAPTLPPLVTPPSDAADEAPPETAPNTHADAPETAGPGPDSPETAETQAAEARTAESGTPAPDEAAPETADAETPDAETGDAATGAQWPVTTPALHGPMPIVEPRPFDLGQPSGQTPPPILPAEAPPATAAAEPHEDGGPGPDAAAAPERAEAVPVADEPAPAPAPPEVAEAPPDAADGGGETEAPLQSAGPEEEPPHEEPSVVAAVELPQAAAPEDSAAPPDQHIATPDDQAVPDQHAAVEPPAPPAPAPPAPAVPTDGPIVVIVIGGLGLSSGATEAAIQDLPANVTLSFSPYSSRLGDWVARARAAGHEVLLDLPMEPEDFPRSDPGPQALMTGLDAAENLRRLDWVLSRSDAIVGVGSYMGSRFAADAEAMRPVLEEIRARGLIYLDTSQAAGNVAATLGGEIGLTILVSDLVVDPVAARQTVDDTLARVEAMAKRDGDVVAVGTAYPVTIERVAAWARGLAGSGVALAPISALAAR